LCIGFVFVLRLEHSFNWCPMGSSDDDEKKRQHKHRKEKRKRDDSESRSKKHKSEKRDKEKKEKKHRHRQSSHKRHRRKHNSSDSDTSSSSSSSSSNHHSHAPRAKSHTTETLPVVNLTEQEKLVVRLKVQAEEAKRRLDDNSFQQQLTAAKLNKRGNGVAGEIAYKKASRERRALQHAIKMGSKAKAYEDKERLKMNEFRKAMGLPPANPDNSDDDIPQVMIGPRPPVM